MNENFDNANDELELDDLELPEAPRLEIYKETFNGITDVTNEHYKNRGF